MPKGKINTNRKGLTQKQYTFKRQVRERIFVDEYFKDFNGTMAATRAGYSAKTAGSIAERLLKKVEIKELIAARRKELEIAAKMTQEEWVKRWELLSRANLKQLASWQQETEASDATLKVKSSEEMSDEEAWLLNEISIKKGKHGNSLGIKVTPKHEALRELGKALGYYPERKGEGDTVNNLNINLHRGSDPMDLSALNSAEKAQLRALFAKMAPKVIGEGKGE